MANQTGLKLLSWGSSGMSGVLEEPSVLGLGTRVDVGWSLA